MVLMFGKGKKYKSRKRVRPAATISEIFWRMIRSTPLPRRHRNSETTHVNCGRSSSRPTFWATPVGCRSKRIRTRHTQPTQPLGEFARVEKRTGRVRGGLPRQLARYTSLGTPRTSTRVNTRAWHRAGSINIKGSNGTNCNHFMKHQHRSTIVIHKMLMSWMVNMR